MLNDWLDRFFDEKDLPEVNWELTGKDGNTHFISNAVVIESIKTASHTEQEKIRRILVEIDFKHGDVNHFLSHLAQALVDNF